MRIFTGLFLLVFSFGSFADPMPSDDLSGETLRAWLKDNWYNRRHQDLGYNIARRHMYGFIDKDSSGNVSGVYSGFTQRGSDTTFLDPINAEHMVPQSWFDRKSPMKSDIHHLFPTHKNVNSDRGSLPFDEIEDSQTDNWYVSDGSGLERTRTIPTSNIDAYSERDINKAFEPPEGHKGNLARAVYYFYTMYPAAAGDISKIADRDILFQWHQIDPVDAIEKQRNDRIEEKQGNRNPYIDHPELVARAWGHDDDVHGGMGGVGGVHLTDEVRTLKADVDKLQNMLDNIKERLNKLESDR